MKRTYQIIEDENTIIGRHGNKLTVATWCDPWRYGEIIVAELQGNVAHVCPSVAGEVLGKIGEKINDDTYRINDEFIRKFNEDIDIDNEPYINFCINAAFD